MTKKKVYEPPSVKRVRLDIKASVLGNYQTSYNTIVAPSCIVPGSCPTPTPTRTP